MRDDAVLGRALPLDRGLGPSSLCLIISMQYTNVKMGVQTACQSVGHTMHKVMWQKIKDIIQN